MKKTSPSRRPAKARRERPDLYQQVTDNIIGAIERTVRYADPDASGDRTEWFRRFAT